MTKSEYNEYWMFAVMAHQNIPVGLKMWERAQELEKKYNEFIKKVKFPTTEAEIQSQLEDDTPA